MKTLIEKLGCNFYAFCAVSIWALANVANRVLASSFYPAGLSAMRFLFASAAMLAVVVIKKMPFPEKRDLPLFFIAGASGFAFYTIAISTSAKTINAATSSVIVASSPIVTAVIAFFIFKEQISKKGWLSISTAFFGILVLTFYKSTLTIDVGIVWALSAALAMCCYNLVSRKLTSKYNPLTVTAYAIFAATLLQVGYLPRGMSDFVNCEPYKMLIVLYLGVISSAVGYLFWSFALKTAKRTSDATNWMFVTPLFTALASAVLIGEMPSLGTVIGGILIIFGLYSFNKSKA